MSQQSPQSAPPIASELVREDPAFADIVLDFVEGLPKRIKAMEEAVRAADFEALRVAAHQLKGSGGGYGYPILTDRAGMLEQSARDGAIDECVTAFEDLKNLCGRVTVTEG